MTSGEEYESIAPSYVPDASLTVEYAAWRSALACEKGDARELGGQEVMGRVCVRNDRAIC